MALNLSLPGQDDLKPRITVFGVGGAGGNAVNNMIEKALDGVEFVVANTDAQALSQSRAPSRIQLGVKVTEGLGAGARPTVGAAAAEESIQSIVDNLAGAHMCFITAGMGGGTGTGAAPIIAQAARELGVLTVGVVTKPFQFEGAKRMRQAEEGVEALQKVVDTLIIIPNQNLFRLANERTTFSEAFALADDVLYQGVKGVTDLMVRPGLINLDFADVRAVMDEMGKAMMGTGEASGENRAVEAAEKAIANPLLDEISLEGAKGVLINITGGHDLTLFELDEAANKIREKVDPEANIIVGSTLDPDMEGMMRVSVVATGIDAVARSEEVPVPRRQLAQPLRDRVSAEMQHQPAAARMAPAGALRPAPRPAQPAPQPPVQQPVPQAPAAMAAPRAPLPPAPPAPVAPQTAAHDRSLFDDPIFAESAQDDGMGDDYVEAGELPPPAYRPRPDHAPQQRAEPRAESFAAPRPAAGTPSAEALARLQNAVRRAPEGARAPVAEPRGARPADGERGGRFGLNSLINRMTGGGAPDQPAPRAQPAQQPWQDEDAADQDHDRIEIPAFLRRQAN
ncbi:MAG: cell division protein FtsZ [Rubellimicrobium sp.]|nr:cell division protein FtsZ [Rubellimicrobium sp.]